MKWSCWVECARRNVFTLGYTWTWEYYVGPYLEWTRNRCSVERVESNTCLLSLKCFSFQKVYGVFGGRRHTKADFFKVNIFHYCWLYWQRICNIYFHTVYNYTITIAIKGLWAQFVIIQKNLTGCFEEDSLTQKCGMICVNWLKNGGLA